MSKRKLLLADDSVTIQKVVNLTFADEGIEVISVGDGDSALDKFIEVSPDLVMADVNMPGLTGYQLCEKIRLEGANRQTPVILLVGSFEPFDEEEARRVGADDYLTKPFQSIRQLVNKVTVLLNSSPEAETAKLPEPPPQITSFDDTLEMEKADSEDVATTEYSDSGYDDEMIESSPASSFAFDESQKFETKPAAEPEYDYSATQPLTSEEIKDFDLVNTVSIDKEEIADDLDKTIADEETVTATNVFNDEPEVVENTAETVEEAAEITEEIVEEPIEEIEVEETPTAQTEDEIPMPEVADVLQLDEANPLELPPIESDGENREESAEEASSLVSFLNPQTDTVAETTATTSEITPDLIEQIVQKVMERLSEKEVRAIAWEVVPEVTERIVKKMAEENLKK